MRGLVVYMRGLALFVAGIVAGTFMMQPSAAQENIDTGLRLNHVGIAVKPENLEKSVDFYTKVMGFRVAFHMPGAAGKPGTTYFNINRDTFLELAPASANLPEGITHIGIETKDLNSTIARLRGDGATVRDAHLSVATKAMLSDLADPNGIRLELIELTPDSLHKKAEESWK